MLRFQARGLYEQVKRSRAIALVALGPALALVSGAAGLRYIAAPAGAPRISEAELGSALVRCVEDHQALFAEKTSSCLADSLLWMVNEDGLESTDAALASAIAEDPSIAYVCHEPAHKAGRSVFEGLRTAATAVRQLRAGVCASGLLHGVLDASVPSITPADFALLVSTCESLPVDEELGRCADSLGHVAGFRNSPSWCSLFSARTGQENCGIGYVMAFYQPVGALSPREGIGWEDVAKLCAEWPRDAAPTGCAIGAAYAFTRGFAPQGQALEIKTVSPSEEDSLVRAVLYAQQVGCGTLEPSFRSRCSKAVLEAIPPPMARHALMSRVCAEVRENLRNYCESVRSGR